MIPSTEPRVVPGSRLLSGYGEHAGLAAHRDRFGVLPRLDVEQVRRLAELAHLEGRGGAGFPFAVKVAAAARGRRSEVVVNLAEGEPASGKDRALAVGRPHLVLDGAVLGARALGTRTIHLVLPRSQPDVRRVMERAAAERSEGLRVETHLVEDRFVAGQARAVLEVMAGRPNLPVTAWEPEAVRGHRNRPTLLSNAETWAQLAALVLPGAAEAPATTLLTVHDRRGVRVVEASLGTPWPRLLDVAGSAAWLVGGYHGAWVRAERLGALTVDRAAMRTAGVPLGAGVVLALPAGHCPVTVTARITAYLAEQSARRCGPCLNGLPALAEQVRALAEGEPDPDRVRALCRLVEGRGACAHPDGTARLVRSLLDELAEQVDAHLVGECSHPVAVAG